MELDLLAILRRIRHIFTGWFLLIGSFFCLGIPIVGPGISGLVALLALFYVLRIFRYGHAIQGLVLLFGVAAVLVAPIFMPGFTATANGSAETQARKALADAGLPPLLGEQSKPKPQPQSPVTPSKSNQERKRSGFLPPSKLLNTSILDRNPRFPELPRDRSPSVGRTTPDRQGRADANGETSHSAASGNASRARPMTPEQQVLDVILKCRQAEQRRDIAGAMNAYRGQVLYFGKTQLWTEIRADKLDYFQKWPQISESIVSEPKVYVPKPGHARVIFRSTFRVSNPVTRKWCSGTIDNEYLLLTDHTGWKITSQEGDVSNLQKGTF